MALHIMPGHADYHQIAARLGPHKRGKSCWYVRSFDPVGRATAGELIRAGLDDLSAE